MKIKLEIDTNDGLLFPWQKMETKAIIECLHLLRDLREEGFRVLNKRLVVDWMFGNEGSD